MHDYGYARKIVTKNPDQTMGQTGLVQVEPQQQLDSGATLSTSKASPFGLISVQFGTLPSIPFRSRPYLWILVECTISLL